MSQSRIRDHSARYRGAWHGPVLQHGARGPLRDAFNLPLPPRSAVSTFWMANPNNNLINCAAAGSEVSRNASSLGESRGEGRGLEVAGASPDMRVL